MKKATFGFIFLIFCVLAYSRQWFFQDFVLRRQPINQNMVPWLLVIFLTAFVLLCTFFVLSRLKQWQPYVISFLQWLEKPSQKQWIFWILLLSIVVKVSWFYLSLKLMGADFFSRGIIPTTVKYHMVMAEQLMNGQGFSWNGHPICMRPPGYSFIEAVLFSFSGVGNPWPVILFNNLCGLLLVLCAYGIGKTLFNETIGRLTSLMSLFSWRQLFFSNFLIEDFVFAFLSTLIAYFLITKKNSFFWALGIGAFVFACTVFILGYFQFLSLITLFILLTLALWGWKNPERRHVIGIGLFIGFANYVRPPLILLPFFLPIVYKLQGLPIKSAIRNSFVVFMVMIATLSPWILRNSTAMGRLTSLSTTGGQTFFEDLQQICPKDAEFERFLALREDHLAAIYHMIVGGRTDIAVTINQSEIDKQLWRYAVKCIIRNPVGYLNLVKRRTLQLLLNADQVLLNSLAIKHLQHPIGWNAYLVTQLINVVIYGILLFLCGMGVFYAFHDQRHKLTGFVLLLYYAMLLVFMFNPLNRYRLPIWTFVYLYASYGVIQFLTRKPSMKEQDS